MQTEMTDCLAVFSANLFNLLMVAIMLSRPKRWSRLEHFLGIASVALILPFGFVLGVNIYINSDIWMIVLPGWMVIFLLLEALLDYVFKVPFRQSRWLWAYLLSFYLAQWAMIGYAFLAQPVFGFVTLVTYFLSLGATAYSYAKVGHGDRAYPGV